MADIVNLIGLLLRSGAIWLSRTTAPVPWPLVFGALILPFAAVLRTSLWILRGGVWPVPCMYFHTQQRRTNKACLAITPGEWRYCRHHNRRKTMADGHECNPLLRRWERRDRHGRVHERDDIRGAGFVSLFADRDTLLFHRGLARRPRDVIPDLRSLGGQLRYGWSALRNLSIRAIVNGSPKRAVQPAPGVSARMPRVISATRVALLAFALGLIIVGTSILFTHHRTAQAVLQYCATFAFIIVSNALRFGIWKNPDDEPEWSKAMVVDSVKALAVLLLIAVAGAGVSSVAQASRSSSPVTPAPSVRPTLHTATQTPRASIRPPPTPRPTATK